MATSIKLTDEFVEEARLEAEVVQRSVGAQVEYWAKLGRALENTPGIDMGHIRDTLNGTFRLDNLTAVEQAKALDALSAAFDEPDATTRDHYAALGAQPGAVGTDGKGGIVRRKPPSRARQGA